MVKSWHRRLPGACRTYSAENHAGSGPQEDTAVFQETVTKKQICGGGATEAPEPEFTVIEAE